MKKSRVHNPKYLEKYFTQFPNIIDDSDLSPYEYRLLIHYYRVGETWEGVRKTGEICKMSIGKVSSCRKSLEEKGFIRTEERGDGVTIYLTDLSKQNVEKYSHPQSVHEVNTSVHEVNTSVHEVNTSVHEVNGRCSSGEHKKNHSKNNQLRITNSSESKDSDTSNAELKIKNKGKKGVEFYSEFVELWCDQYPILGFDKVSGAKIKELIKKTVNYLKVGGKPTDKEHVVGMFSYVLNYIKTTNHWCHGKDINTFETKYLSIVNEIKNGKSGFTKKPSTRDIINSL
jgi:DNA-binding MarR family transcriptional regulator